MVNERADSSALEGSDDTEWAAIEELLRERLGKALPAFRRGLIWYVICCLVALVAQIGDIWLVLSIQWLVDDYGFGYISPDSLEHLTALEGAFLLPWLLAALGGAVLFCRLLYAAQIAGTHFRFGTWRWKFRWNVIALFVPIANLYFPWAGFAEIHERWLHYGARRHRDWEKLGFPWPTLVVVLLYMAYALASRYAGFQAEGFEGPVRDARHWQELMDSVLATQLLSAVAFLAAAAASSLYLHKLYLAMRRVAENAPADARFAPEIEQTVGRAST